MAGGFTKEFMDELKYKCDIVDVISQYVPLTKKGGKYFGCCPFHNEKTASFCVMQAQGYFHCFGCGVSGDVVKFVQDIESVSFFDAVKILAERAGMMLPEFKPDPDYEVKKEKKEILKSLMKETARYYNANLSNPTLGKEARDYLASRGINGEIITRYGLGLSLDYDSLQKYMRLKGYTPQNLLDCGLVNGDRLTDAFGNRIIVPIINNMNDVVAFGGRIYHGEKDVAKYKNSTNTELFDKGKTVYGINFVKKDRLTLAIKDLILVEGYMDVISLGAAGIRNVVAGMGTALTDGQINEIKKISTTLYVCYDGDGAGHKATIKNIELLKKADMDIKVVSLPEGSDPDDVVKAEGADGFMKYVENALPIVDYKLKLCRDAYDLTEASGRAKYVAAAVEVINSIESFSEREVYLQTVEAVSGVSAKTIESDTKPTPEVEKAQEAILKEKENKAMLAARFVLNRMLSLASYAKADDIKLEWLPSADEREIYNFFVEKNANLSDIFGELEGNLEIDRVLDVNLMFSDQEKESRYYQDCVCTIADNYINGRLEYLKSSYGTLADADSKREVLIEIQNFQKKLKAKNIKDKL
ncbi:MAG: DNA primase [Clostridia bacterium]